MPAGGRRHLPHHFRPCFLLLGGIHPRCCGALFMNNLFIQPGFIAVLLMGALLMRPGAAVGQARSFALAGEFAQGQSQDDVTREASGPAILCTFCGSNSVTRMVYYHRYALSGVNMTYNLRAKSATGLQSFGLGLRGGRQRTGFLPLAPDGALPAAQLPVTSSRTIYDVNPYVEGRAKWGRVDLGYRAGVHIGSLLHQASVLADTALLPTRLAPDVQLWVGNRRTLFAQADAGVGTLALGNYTSRFGLGTGLGTDDGRYLLAGLAVARNAASYTMGFLGARVPLFRSGLTAEPYAATNFSQHHQLHVRLSYQFAQAGSGAPAN